MKIYRLITRNSYEREMFDKASLKLGLDKAVLQSMSGRENANSGVSFQRWLQIAVCVPCVRRLVFAMMTNQLVV